jgi:hypothetical protein
MIVFLLSLLALVLLSLGLVSLALPGDSICGLSSDRCTRDLWRTCHNGFVFCSACRFFFRIYAEARYVDEGNVGR